METGLSKWRARWEGAGVPTIPLLPGDKKPVCLAWQARSSADQWAEVGGASYRGNIGVIMGNGNAAIDCDAPETILAVAAGLAGMGVEVDRLPAVKTPSGGLHIYIRVDGAPGGAYATLAPQVGPGELRYGPNSLLCAPCSEVGGTRYLFVAGWPELIPTLQPIRWQDLYWLVAPTVPTVAPTLDAPPIPLLRRAMPRRAEMLLRYLADPALDKGKSLTLWGMTDGSIKVYQSRSEAEMAVVAMLILAGWTFAEIQNEFERRLPGHYHESRNPARYLSRTYARTLGTLATSPTRLQIVDVYHEAQAAAWPGRGGMLERAVYCGLLSIGWQWDSWEVHASNRCLAEAAAASGRGVRNALARLRTGGMVTRIQGWHADFETGELIAQAAKWRVECEPCTISTHKTHVVSLGRGASADAVMGTDCARDGAGGVDAATAETWARVGRSAGAVYGHLGADPQTVKALALATGKCRNTTRTALARLLAYDLAERTPGGWVRGAGDLGDVAREVDAEGHARRRRTAHDLQRESWYGRIRSKRCG